MKLNVLRADPAGNITLFVLDPVEKAQRGKIAEQLMAIEEFKAEQVGFYCPPTGEADGHMEMMGGEFCGNATRAFGMLIAQEKGGLSRVRIEASGCDHLVNVDVDLAAGTSRSEMPLPQSVTAQEVEGHKGTLVHLGGIAHLVVEGVEPSVEFFEKAEPLFRDIQGLDAYGVIFLGDGKMTPLVKVPAANSLVWEGSCGSGSLASAVAQSQGAPDGEFSREYVQPAGVVRATVVRQGGKEIAAYIGGPVRLEQPVEVEI
ncbi:hypothetical protein [Pseudoflavonifractor phocaeensis]|uniref:hypothetical protein n=1 Tax=Pseudoflavonifractor phocaeensis TaxID=1870988 RepID=UPI001F31CFF1|nr:hypothetical protein [Pseudoflavonifractor phocaeensis]MCF2595176.1 hypothetical protein [Pseudoflavonifractor phocaeensis]